MFLKAFFLCSCLIVAGCVTPGRGPSSNRIPPVVASAALESGAAKGIPIIPIRGGSLTLRFDVFQADVSYYRVSVRQMNRDWSEGPLLPGVYLRGVSEDVISEGAPSTSQEPLYTAYTYRFPNDNMGVRVSGNYMMDVIDPYSGARMLSLPFMVSEDLGEADFKVEELFNQHPRHRILHQPFLEYQYPAEFRMPELDIHVAFVQNRWWMDQAMPTILDQSQDGVLRYHLSREDAFVGMLDVYSYTLTDVGRLTEDVVQADAGAATPSVVKNPDVDGLTRPIVSAWVNSPAPRRSRDARYGQVTFQFETTRPQEPMYVAGTFNNWQPRTEDRLWFDDASGYWVNTRLLKEGTHRYSYVTESDRYAFSSVMAGSAQEYTALVYFHDPGSRYDRLLKTVTLNTR